MQPLNALPPVPLSQALVPEPHHLAVPDRADFVPASVSAGVLATWAFGGVVLGAALLWSYWPTLNDLVSCWNRIPDYSHGYLVVPLAAVFLWFRRDLFPGVAQRLSWCGMLLVGLSIVVRYAGARFFLGGIDGWSIPFWVAGTVWFLFGWAILRWSLPAIAFLGFMTPLPFGWERGLSYPLQGVATRLSCWILQMLGQPALAEGHTLWVRDFHLEVEQACSGLRIFVGILALAFAYLVLVRRSWLERSILLLSAIPVALLANAMRIVCTAMLYQYVSGEAAETFAHDLAGWIMIPFAAGLFGMVLYYLGRLLREVEQSDAAAIVRFEREGLREGEA